MKQFTKEELCEMMLSGVDNLLAMINDRMNEPEVIAHKALVYPENCTEYWYLNSYIVQKSSWDNDDMDAVRFEIGNYFATEKEADAEWEWRLLNTKILNTIALLNKEENWVADFSDGKQVKWYLSYSEDNGNVENGCCYSKHSHEKNKYFSHNVCIKLLTIYTEEEFKFWLTREKA